MIMSRDNPSNMSYLRPREQTPLLKREKEIPNRKLPCKKQVKETKKKKKNSFPVQEKNW